MPKSSRHFTTRFLALRSFSRQGFSIVELLLVVLIIMLIGSIMIPNLIDAIHKAKQRRTMAELRLIGNSWMSWLTDQAGAASAGAQQFYRVDGFRELTYEEIYEYLHPSDTFFYMQAVPSRDAWGSQLTFYLNGDPFSDRQLLLCAAARDDQWDACTPGQPIPVGPFIASNFDEDIIWADGYMVRWPDIVGGLASAP